MSTINKVHYMMFDQSIRDGQIPQVQIESDGMAYGSITLSVDAVNNISHHVYPVSYPTTAESRWTEELPDYDSTSVLYSSSTLLSTGKYRLDWQFNPKPIPAVHNDNFAIEFLINDSSAAITKQDNPRVIVQIRNKFL